MGTICTSAMRPGGELFINTNAFSYGPSSDFHIVHLLWFVFLLAGFPWNRCFTHTHRLFKLFKLVEPSDVYANAYKTQNLARGRFSDFLFSLTAMILSGGKGRIEMISITLLNFVWVKGFEPSTLCAQITRAIRLRHTQMN